MIATITGKNQTTIPADTANEVGLRNGSRIAWQHGSEPDEFRCIILPDPVGRGPS